MNDLKSIGHEAQRALGIKIKYLRIKGKMTQEQLEEKSHISTRHISDIENGLVDCKLSTIIRLAFALGYSLTDFLEIDVSDFRSFIESKVE